MNNERHLDPPEDIEYPADFDDGLIDWEYEKQRDADLDQYLADLDNEQDILSEYEKQLERDQ